MKNDVTQVVNQITGGNAEMGQVLIVLAAAGAALVALLVLIGIVKRFMFICRPNEVLIFSGRKHRLEDGTQIGYRVVGAGRALRIPILEKVDRMRIENIPIDIRVNNAYSKGGIPLAVQAIANIKVSSHPYAILNAIERFLGRSAAEILPVARQTLEGTLREVLAQLTPEEVNEDRLKFAEILIRNSQDDLSKLGLALDTLKILHVSDETGYLDSIGRGRIATVLRDAEVAESQANQEAQQAQAAAKQRAEVAKAEATKNILQKKNGLRTLLAQLEGQASAIEKEAAVAAQTARAQAEQELQGVRADLEKQRLQADVVAPAEAYKVAQASLAKGEAAPTAENGAAVAEVLKRMNDAWMKAGDSARDIYLIQQIENLTKQVVSSFKGIVIEDVSVIDAGDGRSLPAAVSAFPRTVAAIWESLKATTGIDVPALLGGGSGASGDGAREGR